MYVCIYILETAGTYSLIRICFPRIERVRMELWLPNVPMRFIV